MSEQGQTRRRVARRIGNGIGMLLLAFVGFFVLAMVGLERPVVALLEILWHLATGFVRFLSSNLRKISSDAGTWGPGLAAFLLALVIIHRLGASWAGKRQRPCGLPPRSPSA